MDEIIAAFGLRRDGQWDVEHLDGRKEVVCSREMDRRGITVQNSGEVKTLQGRAQAAKARVAELEAQVAFMREALELCHRWLKEEFFAEGYPVDGMAVRAEEAMQWAKEALEKNPGHDPLEELRVLRKVVTDLEWLPYRSDEARCPACGQRRDEGHRAECALGKALGRVK